jgi:hypothetical protein
MTGKTENKKKSGSRKKPDTGKKSEPMSRERIAYLRQAVQKTLKKTPEGKDCESIQASISVACGKMESLVPENNLPKFREIMDLVHDAYASMLMIQGAAAYKYSMYERDVIGGILSMLPENAIENIFLNNNAEKIAALSEEYHKDPKHKESLEKSKELYSKCKDILPDEMADEFKSLEEDLAEEAIMSRDFFFTEGISDVLDRMLATALYQSGGTLAEFPDGSRCMTDGNIRHVRMGSKLDFIYRISMGSNVIYQNILFNPEAPAPTPRELIKLFEPFGAWEQTQD